MEKNTAFENELVLDCFESMAQLKELAKGKQIVDSIVSSSTGSKSPPLAKSNDDIYEGLLRRIKLLKECKNNRIAGLIRKHKLEGDASVVFLALCDEVYSGKGMLRAGELARLLAKQHPGVFFDKLKLFDPSQRLMKCGLICFDREQKTSFPFERLNFIEPDSFIE